MFNFGQSSNSTNSNFGGFNFNQPQQQAAQQQPSSSAFSFGSSVPAVSTPTSNIFGSFNSSAAQAQPSQQPQLGLGAFGLNQQTSTGTSYPRDTNFMDLPAELRQNLEALEKTIQSHADASRPLSNRVDPSQQLDQIHCKLSLLEEKIAAYSCLHAQQNSRISSLKKSGNGHWRYSESTARTIEASRNQHQNLNGNGNGKVTWTRAFSPNDPTASHYEEILKEMDSQLNEAEGMAEALRKQIEPFVNVVSNSTNSVESVKFLLKTEQEIFISLQRRYNQVRDEIELMRRNYRNFCSKFRKDSRDPFSPKVVETVEREKERENHKLFLGSVNRPAPTIQQQQQQVGGLTSMLPSATTSLPSKPATSSLGLFSFGRN